MITQDFIREFEIALLKGYNRASRAATPKVGATIVEAAKTQEQFMNAFLAAFQEQSANLEQEIGRGGHRDTSRLLMSIQKLVGAKVRTLLLRGTPTSGTFQRVVRELRNDIRTVFYEPSR